MSGILGVWNSQKPHPWQTMLDELDVLGRDSKGDWHDPSVGLSLGRTQFFNTPESCLEAPVVQFEGCVLVWDGRLDDRAPLLTGRTNVPDAQLLIESYRRWGVDCLSHLVGEFAFILWDAASDRLLVGCDKIGGRTIAYFWDGQTLLVSSRLLALLLHPQVSPQLNDLYVAHVLCDFWAQPPGITPFTDIKRLRPGWALILQSGQLQHRQITQFSVPDRYPSVKSPDDYYEKFWYLLNQSVKDRLRTRHKVCTTLSGGLDSTTVTVSLLNHLPAIDAFSNITTIYPEFDEREPIQSFLRQYPQVTWHPVNSDDAWTLSEPWDELPATDDPFSIVTLAMDLGLMKQARQLGCSTVFTGEWGDELFHTSIQDQARARNWQQVFQYFKANQRWHSILWWEFVVPHLPRSWQSYWFDRYARVANPVPEWLSPTHARSDLIRAATQEFVQLTLAYDQLKAIAAPIEYSHFVGGTQAYRVMIANQQLEYVSPFLDSRLIEFAIHLPPSLQADTVHEKIFLRQANFTTLPEDVQWKPKDNYFDPLKYAGIGRGDRAISVLEKIKSCSYLEHVIDFNKAEAYLKQYRHKYAEEYIPGQLLCSDVPSNFCALFAFYLWYEKIQYYLLKTKV